MSLVKHTMLNVFQYFNRKKSLMVHMLFSHLAENKTTTRNARHELKLADKILHVILNYEDTNTHFLRILSHIFYNRILTSITSLNSTLFWLERWLIFYSNQNYLTRLRAIHELSRVHLILLRHQLIVTSPNRFLGYFEDRCPIFQLQKYVHIHCAVFSAPCSPWWGSSCLPGLFRATCRRAPGAADGCWRGSHQPKKATKKSLQYPKSHALLSK